MPSQKVNSNNSSNSSSNGNKKNIVIKPLQLALPILFVVFLLFLIFFFASIIFVFFFFFGTPHEKGDNVFTMSNIRKHGKQQEVWKSMLILWVGIETVPQLSQELKIEV